MARFHVKTFGCQMNQHDSERLAELLQRAGHVPAATAAGADLLVVNTCSVRAKAEQKLRSELGRLAGLRRKRPGLVLCVAGCVAQQEGERLVRGPARVDIVIGPDNIPELPGLFDRIVSGAPPQVRTSFDLEAPRFLGAGSLTAAATPKGSAIAACAFVTVMKGCNERCSFCVVPSTRGPERYRAASEILDEVARLVRAGVREVTLLGQTVNSYHDPARALPRAPGFGEGAWRHTSEAAARTDESEFASLLRAIVGQVPELKRLRYTAPHPRYLTGSLIRAHRELPELAAHVHMPVQSGSDRILKRMVRRHTVAEYEERVSRLTEAVPGLTLSTDVIVGFPGETRVDFQATIDLVRRVGFTGMFGFKYSPRPQTPAFKLADDVPEPEKAQRLAEAFAVSDTIRDQHLSRLQGQLVQVLVEGCGDDGRWTGRTERNEIVHFESPGEQIGGIVRVRIVSPFKHSLLGERETGPETAGGTGTVDPARRLGRRALKVVRT